MLNKWDNPKTTKLLKTILALKNLKEAKSFFSDLLTISELKEFGNRWLAAQMLNQRIPYSRIIKATGLSSTTVARISKWLQSGKGGYQLMLKRLFKNHHHNSLPVGKGLC